MRRRGWATRRWAKGWPRWPGHRMRRRSGRAPPGAGEGGCEADVGAKPCRCRSLSHEGLTSRPRLGDLAPGPGHWQLERGYSCGTAPALHRLRHLPAGLSAAAPDALLSCATHGTSPPTHQRRATHRREELDGRSRRPRMGVQRRLLGGIAEHGIQHLLDGKGVRTAACRCEEVAVAVPAIVVEGDRVAPVVAAEGGLEAPQLHTIRLVRVAHRLLDLAGDARMHSCCPPGADLPRRHLVMAPVSPWLWRAALSASQAV